jgi:hypothetical protein
MEVISYDLSPDNKNDYEVDTDQRPHCQQQGGEVDTVSPQYWLASRFSTGPPRQIKYQSGGRCRRRGFVNAALLKSPFSC